MKDLTNTEKAELLSKIKSFLDITWTDTTTDNEVWDDIESSIFFIDETCGHELDYLADNSSSYSDAFKSLCKLGYSLLKNRVFYMREKSLDDFAKNYQGELTRIYFNGRIYESELSL